MQCTKSGACNLHGIFLVQIVLVLCPDSYRFLIQKKQSPHAFKIGKSKPCGPGIVVVAVIAVTPAVSAAAATSAAVAAARPLTAPTAAAGFRLGSEWSDLFSSNPQL